MYMNLCKSNLACILLFKYLLKKSFNLNVQDSNIDLWGLFAGASMSIV